MLYQHEIGGSWGNNISWMYPDRCWKGEAVFHGHKPNSKFPKLGQVIKTEMEKSFVYFEITEVERMTNPADQFFLKAKPVLQELKAVKYE